MHRLLTTMFNSRNHRQIKREPLQIGREPAEIKGKPAELGRRESLQISRGPPEIRRDPADQADQPQSAKHPRESVQVPVDHRRIAGTEQPEPRFVQLLVGQLFVREHLLAVPDQQAAELD